MMSILDLKKIELKHKIKIYFDSKVADLISRCSYKILNDDSNSILVKDNVILSPEVKNKLTEIIQEVYGADKEVKYTSEDSYNCIWLKVREDFKTYNGEMLEKAWLSDMEIEVDKKRNSITLKGQNAFKNNYVKENYNIILGKCFKQYGFTQDYYDHNHLTFIKNN